MRSDSVTGLLTMTRSSGRPRPSDQPLCARRSQQVFHALCFGNRNLLSEGSQAIVPPALVVCAGPFIEFFDQAVIEQTLENGVQRTGAEPDLSFSTVLDFLQYGVAMHVAVD